jgi:hypothetical protein
MNKILGVFLVVVALVGVVSAARIGEALSAPAWTAFGVLAAAALALYLSNQAGRYTAMRVAAGNEMQSSRFDVLSIHATKACLHWPGRPLLPRSGPYMYLGEAGAFMIVYDYYFINALRFGFPSSSASVTPVDYFVPSDVATDEDLIAMCSAPSADEAHADVDSVITATLDKDVDHLTIRVTGPNGRVAGKSTKKCDVYCHEISFAPADKLQAGSDYTVQLNASYLTSEKTGFAVWSFTTGASDAT